MHGGRRLEPAQSVPALADRVLAGHFRICRRSLAPDPANLASPQGGRLRCSDGNQSPRRRRRYRRGRRLSQWLRQADRPQLSGRLLDRLRLPRCLCAGNPSRRTYPPGGHDRYRRPDGSGDRTGPHLHYEFRGNDEPVDPLATTLPKSSPLDGAQHARHTNPSLARRAHLDVVRSQGRHPGRDGMTRSTENTARDRRSTSGRRPAQRGENPAPGFTHVPCCRSASRT